MEASIWAGRAGCLEAPAGPSSPSSDELSHSAVSELRPDGPPSGYLHRSYSLYTEERRATRAGPKAQKLPPQLPSPASDLTRDSS